MISEILISEDAVRPDEYWSVIADVCDFVNDLRDKRGYVDEELPVAALQVCLLDVWLGQVNNGGVSQYVANWQLYEPQNFPILDRTEQALIAIGDNGFLDLYHQMRRILEDDIKPDGLPVKDGDRDRIEAEFERQSDAFYELNGDFKCQRLQKCMRAFILAQSNTKTLSTEERHVELIRYGNENPHREERFAERQRAREAYESENPIYAAARQLCATAGRTFQQFNAGNTVTLDGILANGMALATDKGACMMICMSAEALLFELKLPPPEAMDAFSKNGDAWLDYTDANPNAYEGLDAYRREEGLLAVLATPTPLWPL
jgi:hypothetical protein